MENCKSALGIAGINFRRWLKDIRVRFLFVLIGCMMFNYLKPFTQYGLATGTKCTPWLFPFLFHSQYMAIGLPKTMLHIGMLLLLCDAPFFYPATPYMVLRSRRNGWCMGECLYIVMTSFVYTLFLQAMCFIMVLPVLETGNRWGDVLRDMMYGSAEYTAVEIKEMYLHYSLPATAIRYYYPIGSGVYSFLAVWGSFTFLGLLMYLVSLVKRNVIWGVASAGTFIFLDPILYRMTDGGTWNMILSPVSWTDIEVLQMGNLNRKMFMTLGLAGSVLIGLIAVLLIVIWRVSQKALIELR